MQDLDGDIIVNKNLVDGDDCHYFQRTCSHDFIKMYCMPD